MKFHIRKFKWKCPICKRQVSADSKTHLQKVIELHNDSFHR